MDDSKLSGVVKILSGPLLVPTIRRVLEAKLVISLVRKITYEQCY